MFGSLTIATNYLTYGIIHDPTVGSGLTKVLAGATVSSFTPLGVGTIAAVVAVVIFLLLIVTKIVLATLLALLFVAAPLAIALWPLPETSWLARTVLQSLIGVLLWPVVWALCFALFAVIGASAFTPGGLVRHAAGQAVGVGRGAVRRLQGAAAARAPGDARRADAIARARPPRAAWSTGARRCAPAAATRGAEGVSGRFGARRRPGRGRRCATRPTSTWRRGCGSARSRSASGRRSPPPASPPRVFGGYLSPLPTQVTIFVSIVGAGLPVAVSYGAMGLEFSVAQFARAGWRYWRQPRRFLAGAGEPTAGYVVARRARPRATTRGATQPRARRSCCGTSEPQRADGALREAASCARSRRSTARACWSPARARWCAYLRAAPKNPLVMSPVEREQIGHAFGQLAGRLQAGQSMQFYVEATPGAPRRAA